MNAHLGEIIIQNFTTIGNEKCGKTTIIRRYIANQFIASNEDTEQDEPQRTSGSPQLNIAQLFTHTLKVPGRKR